MLKVGDLVQWNGVGTGLKPRRIVAIDGDLAWVRKVDDDHVGALASLDNLTPYRETYKVGRYYRNRGGTTWQITSVSDRGAVGFHVEAHGEMRVGDPVLIRSQEISDWVKEVPRSHGWPDFSC